MQNTKGWVSCLKSFAPRVVSFSDSYTMVRSVTFIRENIDFHRGVLYLGLFCDAAYRLRTAEDMIFVLIPQSGDQPDKIDWGSNTVIILSKDADMDQVYDYCRQYLKVQEEVVEKKQRMMDAFFNAVSMQNLLDVFAGIIGFPLMIIDNSYCVIGASSNQECDDPLWVESIRDGYCSYEFVSRFNQLNEIEVINQGDGPVLAGCLMSPMRRCIIRMISDKRPIGYLLSVESSGPFDKVKLELLEQAARMLSKSVAYIAMESGVDLVHATWNAIVNAIEQTPKSDLILREYLLNAGLRKESDYYIILFSLIHRSDNEYDGKGDSLHDVLRSILPFCAFTYYKKDALVVAEFRDGAQALVRLLERNLQAFTESGILISVSDVFRDFSNIRRYYEQAKKAQLLMKKLDKDRSICLYESVRIYDMLSAASDQTGLPQTGLPLYLRGPEIELYKYDMEHGTEYFRTIYSYIKNSRRLQDVSDELHIHKNTVSYRINRIRELFEVDFNDAETRIGFYLAYHALMMQGWGHEGEDA